MPARPDLTIDVETVGEPGGGGWTCRVAVVAPDGSRTEHRVRVRGADLERFDPTASEPGDLVRRSFAFLLEREPRESILHDFELPVIARYFPEYGREIVRKG